MSDDKFGPGVIKKIWKACSFTPELRYREENGVKKISTGQEEPKQ